MRATLMMVTMENISAGTLQLNNRRLIGCLKKATRSVRLGKARYSDLLEKSKSESF